MKKTFYLFVFTILNFLNSNELLAQGGNLQFNRALFSEISQSPPANQTEVTLGTVTVPQGKVWKIERASFLGNFPCGVGQTNYSPVQNVTTINNLVIVTYSEDTQYFPVWLPEGTYTIKSSIAGGCTNYPYNVKFVYTGIEFNLMP
jgi:hypothetical protein